MDFSKVEIEPLFQEFVDFETFAKSDFRAVKVKECTAVPKSKKLLKFVLDDGTGEDRVILSGIHDTYEPEELVGKTLIAITNLPPRKMMGIDSCGMIISAVHHEEGVEKLHCLMVDDHIPAGQAVLSRSVLGSGSKCKGYEGEPWRSAWEVNICVLTGRFIPPLLPSPAGIRRTE